MTSVEAQLTEQNLGIETCLDLRAQLNLALRRKKIDPKEITSLRSLISAAELQLERSQLMH